MNWRSSRAALHAVNPGTQVGGSKRKLVGPDARFPVARPGAAGYPAPVARGFFRMRLVRTFALVAAILSGVLPAALRSAPALADDGGWGGNTSGPFFTGTADVEPKGSWYYEPFVFDSIGHSSFDLDNLQKFAVGLPLNTEFDLYAPLPYSQGKSATTGPVDHFGLGDVALQLKHQLLKDADPYHFLAMPSVSVLGNVTFPTGQYQNLSPSFDGTDQGGNGTYDLDLSVELRKQAAPFQFYVQLADYLIMPSNIRGPYTFNDGLRQLPLGSSLRMVDGNLFYYAAAFEHVLDPSNGFGYLVEAYGETQGKGNLIYGPANAPAWSAFWLAPELEITWPSSSRFTITWGAGVALPVVQNNYPRTFIPMATVTFYFNSGGAR